MPEIRANPDPLSTLPGRRDVAGANSRRVWGMSGRRATIPICGKSGTHTLGLDIGAGIV
jgi:hypothetical protein